MFGNQSIQQVEVKPEFLTKNLEVDLQATIYDRFILYLAINKQIIDKTFLLFNS